MELSELVFELCKINGVSGSEEPAISYIKNILSKYADVSVTPNGSLIAKLGNRNASKTILLDAHIDRIGLMVTDIDDRGFVKVAKCGGIDPRILQDSVLVLNSNPEISGVVSCMPPHLSDGNEDKASAVDKISVDFGLEPQEIKRYLKIGDMLTYKSEPRNILNNRICSAALDNRCSVAALIYCAQMLSDCDLDYSVAIVFSVQEETFGTGAKTSSFLLDADEAIVVDVSFASQPDISGLYSSIELGKGPMICISPILNRDITDKLIEICNAKGISYQLEPIAGATGTNADHISITKSGVKTALVSVPQRNMHTPCEIVDVDDVKGVASLICEYIRCGGAFQ